MMTAVPVNVGLTATVTSAQMLEAGFPGLLSFTITEYVLFEVRGPVENEEVFCPPMGVAQTSPLYH
jgi:hypothetical protein